MGVQIKFRCCGSFLVEQKGETVKSIQKSSGAYISIQQQGVPDNALRPISIRGAFHAVNQAAKVSVNFSRTKKFTFSPFYYPQSFALFHLDCAGHLRYCSQFTRNFFGEFESFYDDALSRKYGWTADWERYVVFEPVQH